MMITTPLLLDALRPGDRFTFANAYPNALCRVYVKGAGRTFCLLAKLLTDSDWITYQGPSEHLPVRPIS